MLIKVVPDVGAPALVTGVHLLTQEYAPGWNEWASYIMAGGAYIATGLGLVRGSSGDFVKNVGIAAFPLAVGNIVNRIRQPVASRAAPARLALRPIKGSVSQPINRQFQPEFAAAGAHAF